MLREYQERAVASVQKAWDEGARSVLLCGPTGSGKTEQGRALASLPRWTGRPVWAVHRNDLNDQAVRRVGDVVDVVSIPSLARTTQLNWTVPLVVFDEAHHVPSKSWQHVVSLYPNARIVGLTASPERGDGAPLDVFERLVVSATYSELLAQGHLCPARVFRPTKAIDRGLALDPVEAYFRYARGMRGFVFVSTVKQAASLRERFVGRGVRADVLHGTTKKDVRQRLIQQLSDGEIDLLINCTALTEGIDVPSAQVCILARRCLHSGLYIQTTGRILRPHRGKVYGVVLDLVGASERHGLPTDDREYALSGTAIRRSRATPLRQCFVCGAVMAATARRCISCEVLFVPGVHAPPKIHNVALREVYAGSETPDAAKQAELNRLCAKLPWPAAAKQFEKLFGSRPSTTLWGGVPRDAELTEFRRLLKTRTPQQASVIMKSLTGRYPTKYGATA